MKKILLWTGLGITLFILLVVVTFVVLSFLHPLDKDVKLETISGDQKLAKEMLTQKQKEIELLKSELDSLRQDLVKTSVVRDSLMEASDFNEGLVREYRKTVELLKAELTNYTQKTLSAKEMAKTYESMKITEMQPILEKLEDHTILELYSNISSRNRKNILMALSAQRAARITQKLVNSSINTE
jgi:flagellar motility protein MotE (MotC chaperone)